MIEAEMGTFTPGPHRERLEELVQREEVKAKKARKWKIALRVFFALLFVVETYFMTRYFTWEEYWRWSAKGFAAGTAFTVALLAIVEVVKWWVGRKIRTAMRRCERCGQLVDFDATCPACRPAA